MSGLLLRGLSQKEDFLRGVPFLRGICPKDGLLRHIGKTGGRVKGLGLGGANTVSVVLPGDKFLSEDHGLSSTDVV